MKKTEAALFALLALITLSYVGARIWFNPFVNDEAYSFLHFVFTGQFIPLLNTPFLSANNHILNSFLGWITYTLFGVNEVLLRLPNFIAFLALLFFSYKFGRNISNGLLRWLFWIMLLGAAPILEFFSYARGYGLSFSLLIGSIYYLQKSIHSGNILREWKSFLLMVLAVLANLNMLHSYLIWLLIFTLLTYRQTSLKKVIPFILLKASPLLYFIPVALKLRGSGELYVGTDSGILKSMNSLLRMFFGEVSRSIDVIPIVLVILIASASLFLFFKKKNKTLIFHLTAAFLVLNILGSVLQHQLLDVLLPVHRSILHWYLLFISAFFFGLDYLAKTISWAAWLIGLVMFGFMFFQIGQYDLFRSADESWRNEQVSDKFYREIQHLSEQQPQMLSLETHLPQIEYTWNFLNLKNEHPLNKMQVNNPGSPIAGDLLFTQENSSFSESNDFEKIAFDPRSGLQLLKRKEFRDRHFVRKNTTHKQVGEIGWIELLNLNEFKTSTPVLIDFGITIQTQVVPAPLLVQILFFNEHDQVIEVKEINIAHLRHDWQKTGTVHFTHILYLWPPATVKLDIGLYNPKAYHLQVDSAECSIFKLSYIR